ncbi:hypothetical protein E4T56_gene3165 [Termitomyces sp. T112]|nr:hypothetical protein E4T56_gene3165 [Termitomyces sp. T112]
MSTQCSNIALAILLEPLFPASGAGQPVELSLVGHLCHDPFPEAPYTAQQTPTPPEPPPQCFVKLPQHSTPTLANSGTFLANSDGPLANSDVFPTAAGTSPGLPEPLGPLPRHA